MSLLDQANAIATRDGARQPVVTTTIDMGDLELFAKAVEKALPKAELNKAAIEKNGLAPTGDGKLIPYAISQKVRGLPRASVTVYYNGKVVWAGIEPVPYKKS